MDLLVFGIRFFARAIALVVAFFLIGFVVFADSIERAPAEVKTGADGIVVLTGGKARIAEAVKLLAEGKAKRLLITGVFASTTKDKLRHLVSGDEELFDCCVDLDRHALNTSGNATETKHWARSRGFTSLIIVTSSYHMPRALVELERVMPKIHLVAYAVVAKDFEIDQWWCHEETLRILFKEYVKYLPALARFGATRFAHRAEARSY